jgi:hypothetical protein
LFPYLIGCGNGKIKCTKRSAIFTKFRYVRSNATFLVAAERDLGGIRESENIDMEFANLKLD